MKALSGGERNRLLLARLFTRPANLLVLDEPTNDLDIETLELLEALLIDWPGTLLLVSHDRAFIDHVVTSTLVFEGEGRVRSTSAAIRIGCGSAGMRRHCRLRRQHREPRLPRQPSQCRPRRAASRPTASSGSSRNCQRASTAMEREQEQLNAAVAAPDFYKETAETIHQTLARLGPWSRRSSTPMRDGTNSTRGPAGSIRLQ